MLCRSGILIQLLLKKKYHSEHHWPLQEWFVLPLWVTGKEEEWFQDEMWYGVLDAVDSQCENLGDLCNSLIPKCIQEVNLRYDQFWSRQT